MNYVLGIDGGASKTVCILMDENGQILGRGEAGASNYQVVGSKAALTSIQAAIELAVLQTEVSQLVQVEAICLGLAGVGRTKDIQVVSSLVEQLKLSNSLPITWTLTPTTTTICHDALIALVGGLGKDVGIVAIAGTGSIVFGRNSQGDTKRVGGWGHILGDPCSAYQIAVEGIKAALKADEGCSPPTFLREQFAEHLSLSNPGDLIEVIYQRGWGTKEIAALAPIVTQAAASGDRAAIRILEQAVEDLVQATQVVIDTLFSTSEVLEVVTTGRVWQGSSLLHAKFKASLFIQRPEINITFPRNEPAVGAGWLALKTLSKS